MKILEVLRADPRIAFRTQDREALKQAAYWYDEDQFIDRILTPQREPRTHYLGYDDQNNLIASFSDPERGSRYPRFERQDPTPRQIAAHRGYLTRRKSLQKLYGELKQELAQDYVRDHTFTPDEIEISFNDDTGYSAWVRNKPVGRAILNITPEGNHPPDTRSIFKVAVKPEYQRRGVARALYQRIEADLAKRGLRLLPSNAQSDEAKGFWKRYRPE